MEYKLHYSKPEFIHLEKLKEQNQHPDFNPYEINELQLYNPIYSRFFEMNDSNYQKIALNHPYHMKDLYTVVKENGEDSKDKNVFIKFSPLLDPYRYMIGKYDVENGNIRKLPKLISKEQEPESHPKLLSPNNTSYVDCFFTYLSSVMKNSFGFENGIDFYGSYLGIQEKYKVALSDDMEYLQNSRFFNENLGKLFHVKDNYESIMNELSGYCGSRKNKIKLCFESEGEDNQLEIPCIEIENIDDEPKELDISIDTISTIETVYNKSSKHNVSSASSTSNSSNNSELNYSSDEEDILEDITLSSEQVNELSDDDDDESIETGSISGSSSSSSCSSSSEEEVYGFIDNFPIQMICMEQCDGTFYQLLEKDKIDEKSGCSALFQVIMILLTYQRVFHFTHNDLHTNNIMYVKTDKPFLYYMFEGIVYKVPTYGKIYKLIDFGRAIYKYSNKTFCSDSFGPGGDASTQYNCEPFFNEKKPRLEPNFSFDLCRLGTSMYDFMMEIDDDISEYDDLQKIVREWCLDDNGKNVLYLKNGQERYPSFKLYKMIARSVHKHTPEAQLERPFFAKYKMEEPMPENEILFSIDKFC